MREQRVSSRYAKALSVLALEQGIEEDIVADKNYILRSLASSRELRTTLNSPIISSYKKKAILKELFESEVSTLMMNFLLLVEDKNRENILSNILEEFTKDYNIRHNQVPVVINSAYELSDEMKDKTVSRMNEITGMTILPEFKLDANIIGGITIRYDDYIFDASVKSQLEKLHRSLLAT